MKNITIALFFMALPVWSSAQIQATTQDGKAVLLFENGTWEYVTEENIQTVEVNSIEIEEGLTKESSLDELFYAESKRLVKYFGPVKGKIKGRAKCIIENGQPKLFFQWEVGLLDSYRYFGQMKKGRSVILRTKSNASVHLFLNEDTDIEFMEKYNFSVLKGACKLTDEQFNVLMAFPVSEIEVGWKKFSETYPVEDGYFFSKTFNKLLE